MKILFINPPNQPFSSKGILIEPIDVIHLATFVKSLGFDVDFLDMDVKKITHEGLNNILNYKKIDICVIVFDYHIPLHNEGTIKEIKEICKILKDKSIKSILGGKIATYYNEIDLKNIGFNFDFYIKNDMEESLKKILESTEKKINIILSNIGKKININEYPIPDRSLCNINEYIDVRTILSSRGCNLKCSFCHVPNFWGNWKSKSPEIVYEEIKYLVDKYNAKKILFLDDNAMAQPKRMEEISKLLINNNIKTTLGCLGTILSFNEDSMINMYKAGFRWIHYGVESGDEKQLIKINKKTNPSKIKEVLKKTKNIGFRIRTSWILDLPDMDEESLLKTEKMIIENPTDEIRIHFLTLRLGSELNNIYNIKTNQFIHNNKQNLNITKVSELLIKESLNRIITNLEKQGYIIITNPDDFINMESLKMKSPELKILSICPLRYGIGWNL